MSTLKTDKLYYMYCNMSTCKIEMYSYKCGCCSAALAVWRTQATYATCICWLASDVVTEAFRQF